MDENGSQMRLQKVLARAGIASRRQCESLIAAGRVKIDGVVVTRMGVMVDPDVQDVAFDDQLIRLESPAHFLVYKPRGVVCTTRDQFERKSVVDLVRTRRPLRLFPVGRMEEDSEGLILVTNDGRFANQAVSYRNPLRHVYYVRLRGRLTQDALDQARKGVWISDGKSGPMWVKVQRWGKKVSTVLCAPTASQHRLVRRVWAKVGFQADKVVRVRLGPLTTDGLKKGGFRRLTSQEVEAVLNPAAEDLGTGLGTRRRPGEEGTRRRPGGEGTRRRPGGEGTRRRPGGESRQTKRGQGKRRPPTRRHAPSTDELSAPTPRRRVIGP